MNPAAPEQEGSLRGQAATEERGPSVLLQSKTQAPVREQASQRLEAGQPQPEPTSCGGYQRVSNAPPSQADWIGSAAERSCGSSWGPQLYDPATEGVANLP